MQDEIWTPPPPGSSPKMTWCGGGEAWSWIQCWPRSSESSAVVSAPARGRDGEGATAVEGTFHI